MSNHAIFNCSLLQCGPIYHLKYVLCWNKYTGCNFHTPFAELFWSISSKLKWNEKAEIKGCYLWQLDHHDRFEKKRTQVFNAIIIDLIFFVFSWGHTAVWEPLHISLVLTTAYEVIITIPIYRVKLGIER